MREKLLSKQKNYIYIYIYIYNGLNHKKHLKKVLVLDNMMDYFRGIACKLIFKSNDFDKKDIGNLMKLIWTNSGHHGKKCNVYKLDKKWAVNALRKKWLHEYYVVFNVVVTKLCRRDKNLALISKFSNPNSLFLISLLDKE